MIKILRILFYPYFYVRDHIKYKKRLKELRERDPFIYK